LFAALTFWGIYFLLIGVSTDNTDQRRLWIWRIPAIFLVRPLPPIRCFVMSTMSCLRSSLFRIVVPCHGSSVERNSRRRLPIVLWLPRSMAACRWLSSKSCLGSAVGNSTCSYIGCCCTSWAGQASFGIKASCTDRQHFVVFFFFDAIVIRTPVGGSSCRSQLLCARKYHGRCTICGLFVVLRAQVLLGSMA